MIFIYDRNKAVSYAYMFCITKGKGSSVDLVEEKDFLITKPLLCYKPPYEVNLPEGVNSEKFLWNF